MAYRFPERYLAYYLATDRLGLITSRDTNSKNNYESIDESLSDGLLVEYTAQPKEIEKLSDVPDVDDTIHVGLIYYANYKLFEDKQDQESLVNAAKYQRLYRQHMKENAGRDKVGGARQIVPFSFTWRDGTGLRRTEHNN